MNAINDNVILHGAPGIQVRRAIVVDDGIASGSTRAGAMPPTTPHLARKVAKLAPIICVKGEQ
jgi:predicted phosphoribosyltransferase